jgi:2-polyprenyl-6-methoxyphenol hydroxylase-like FAD-dependent oxidoreductase
MQDDTDVLIVGAGPTGLALAAELNRQGVGPVIIDQKAVGATTSRACVVHARTMEVLEPLGETDKLLMLGIKVPMFRIRDRDRALLTIDFSKIDSPYPFTLMCPQDRIEKSMDDRLQGLGGHVLRPCRLLRFDESGNGVEAHIEHKGATRIIRAKWLVGCDGIHSTVRGGSGIEFEGGAYEQHFVLADVRMQWPLSREEVTLFYSPDGLVVVAPLPGDHFRIVATVDEAPEQPPLSFMQDVLDRRGPVTNPGQIRDVIWSSRFHIQHRVARQLRRGRVLLCGDAAHVHSPAGGQGMNTGIQDGVSLGETLAAVLKNGDEGRLQSWAEKRHGVASDVVAMTDRLTRIAVMKSKVGQHFRNAAVALAGHVPQVRAAVARKLAELDA